MLKDPFSFSQAQFQHDSTHHVIASIHCTDFFFLAPFLPFNQAGLGVYADSSDDDSDVEDNVKTDDHSDWEPESVLKVRKP